MVRQFTIILFLILGLCACDKSAQAVLDSQSKKINLADWHNKWVIVNYWAGWCDACIEEIPQLNLFYQHHQHEVVLVGVNSDNLPTQQLISAINTLHIRYPVLQADPAKILGLPVIQVLPTTFIINPQGKVIKQLFGPQTIGSLEDIINGHS